MEVYPDAEFIYTYRDIAEVIPSFISLIRTLGEPAGAKLDQNFIRRSIAVYKKQLEKGIPSLEKIRKTNRVHFVDYNLLVENPLGEIRKIYDYFKLSLSGDSEQKMVDYINNDPKKLKYGKHKYSLEEFNLTKEDIREEFQHLTDRLTSLINA